MVNVKEEILEIVKNLPDNATWDDAIYALFLQSRLIESENNIKNGNTLSLQEFKKFIDELEEKYAHNTI